MAVTYRVFEAGDEYALVELMEELGYEISVDSVIDRVGKIRRNSGEVIVAEGVVGVSESEQGGLLGCINAIIDVRLAEGVCGEVVSLVVAEHSRGAGVGKGLTLAAESWLRLRCDRIRVRANALRERAHSFYRSLGYEEIKTQKIFIKHL